jgi:hypothetical protein
VRPLWFCLLACGGCGSYFSGAGHAAATGAVAAATSEDARRSFSLLAGDVSREAAARARDELLSARTGDSLDRWVFHLGTAVDEQEELLLASAGERLRPIVRSSIDEALGPVTRVELASLRDDLFGPVLQVEVNGLIDSAAPHLADAVAKAMSAAVVPVDADVARIQRTADAEAMKWRPIAEGFAAGTGLLALGLVGALVVIRRHGRAIEELRGGSGRPEVASTR